MTIENWIVKLVLSVFLGSLIGFEREYHGRPAGLRTHILVCMGATILTLSGIAIAEAFSASNTPSGAEVSRVIAGIMTGIGFLGAGAIMRTRDMIRGITTAACIWFVAAIGIVIGIDQYVLAVSSTGMALVILTILPLIEDRVAVLQYRDVIIHGGNSDPETLIENCTSVFRNNNLGIHDIDIGIDREENSITLLYHLRIRKLENKLQLLNTLSEIQGVINVQWQRDVGKI